MADDKNKKTDPDFKPQRGQETNEGWDRKNEDSSSETKSTGNSEDDEKFEKLPNEKDLDRGNLTGPGLG
ncbi:MAG: hypothetical protein J7497_04620 [Chitinophagaceae bacterium]|nr:hypothetical protein [Chitinophagaceae bacterium]